MGIKEFTPTSPGRRFARLSDRQEVTAEEPEKSLTEPLHSTGGRNSDGRMTVRGRGGGHRHKYRRIDFKRDKEGVPAKVATIEYDPNRSAYIALLHYVDGEKRYIIAPQNIEVGDEIIADPGADIQPGNALPLESMPVGTIVHNVELKPNKGGQLARSAGCWAQLMAKEEGYALLHLPSGELRRVPLESKATVGSASNATHENVELGKAGRSRWRGRRPITRGVAKNPIDHPHGGGEGRTSGGRHPVTPWGQPTKGLKTRHNKKTERFIVSHRDESQK